VITATDVIAQKPRQARGVTAGQAKTLSDRVIRLRRPAWPLFSGLPLGFTGTPAAPFLRLNWREYQQETAKFFRSLGYDVTIEEKLKGARGEHKADVVSRFGRHGFKCLWVIECKLWSSNVPKEKVLALQSIIEDVGADKGIILSEKGFQSGCFACAQRTNIFLSSLSELRKTHQEDLHHVFVDSMLIPVERAASRARKLAPLILPGGELLLDTKFPVHLVGRIEIFEMALQRYRDGDGRFPIHFGLGDDGNTRTLAYSQDDIIEEQKKLLDRINRLIAELEANPDKR